MPREGKAKGDYRLDDPVVALKGGESEKVAIKPGDPLGSEFVRLILLPPDDDDVMPPKGKEALTGEEVLTIIRWIQRALRSRRALRLRQAGRGSSRVAAAFVKAHG